MANDFRGTPLYVTDHSSAGTTPQWMLSDAPVAYTPPQVHVNVTSLTSSAAFLADVTTVCPSATNSFTTSNRPGLSGDVKTFYFASCKVHALLLR